MSVVTNERHAFVACVEIQVPVHAIDVPRGFGQTAHNVQCVRALLVKGDCPPLTTRDRCKLLAANFPEKLVRNDG